MPGAPGATRAGGAFLSDTSSSGASSTSTAHSLHRSDLDLHRSSPPAVDDPPVGRACRDHGGPWSSSASGRLASSPCGHSKCEKGPHRYERQGPFTGDHRDRSPDHALTFQVTLPVDPVFSSDPGGLRHPATAAPLRQAGEALYGSSSPTDPALPGRSAWEKLYAPQAQRHKGFRRISFTYLEFRRVVHNRHRLLHSQRPRLHRMGRRLWRENHPSRPFAEATRAPPSGAVSRREPRSRPRSRAAGGPRRTARPPGSRPGGRRRSGRRAPRWPGSRSP